MKKQFNERDLLRIMKKAAIQLGGRVSRDTYRTLSTEEFPNEYAIRKHFGTWSAAKQAFVANYPEYADGSREEVLKAYLQKAQLVLGDNFKRDNYRLLKGFPSTNEIEETFGSWSKAVESI